MYKDGGLGDMVLMRLKEIKGNEVIYYFQPEGRGKEGIIKFIFEGEELIKYEILEEPELEYKIMFLGHCLSLARKMKIEGKFLDKCGAAWY